MSDLILRTSTATNETLHAAAETISARITALQERGPDRGAATTLEIIGWSVLVVAIVGIGYVAIKALVDSWSDEVKNVPLPAK